ncbi:MAG: hypothetical protein ACSLFQ_20915 [Thermoanaerobaculia bacterium]
MDEQPKEHAPDASPDGDVTSDESPAVERQEAAIPAATSPDVGLSPATGATPPPSPGWRPADYYAAPRGASRLPTWLPLTCGVAAIVVIGLMAIVGAFLQSGGLAKLVAIAFGQMNADAERMFDDGVAPDARAAFKQSVLAVRDGIAEGTIALESALPLLQEMQKATRDSKLSAEEVEALTGTFEESLAGESGEDPAEPRTFDL